MKASVLVQQIASAIEQHGDLEVVVPILFDGHSTRVVVHHMKGTDVLIVEGGYEEEGGNENRG